MALAGLEDKEELGVQGAAAGTTTCLIAAATVALVLLEQQVLPEPKGGRVPKANRVGTS